MTFPSAAEAEAHRRDAVANAAAALARGGGTMQWELARRTEQLAMAEAALVEETRALDLLNGIGLRLAAELDLGALLQAVTDAGREISGAQLAAFFPAAGADLSEGAALSTQAYGLSGAPRAVFEALGHLRHTPLFALTLREGQKVASPDVMADPRYGHWGPHHGMPGGHPPVRSYLAVPVLGHTGAVLGGLFFGHAQPDFFTVRVEGLLAGLAAQAAVAVQNARLYEREREARQLAEQARAELERRVAERTEALAALNRELEAFAYSVSHDLRSPLGRVAGFARALQDSAGERLDARQQHFLERMRANLDEMAGMIDASLALARLSWQPVRTRRVDLGALARQAFDALAAQDPERRCVLEVAPGLEADGDPVLVGQLIANLVANAWKFTAGREAGRIRFDLAPSAGDGAPVFRLSDNGAGFDMAFADRLFFPFQRLHDAAQFPGHGVGLATVRRIAERHGGRAWAEGRPDHGATFCFTLQPGRATAT